MAIKQKISPFLWFDGNAEDAANFYTSIFKNSRIVGISRNSEGGPGPKGSVLVVNFELEGMDFIALNGGPMFKFTEAISLVVHCETQEEVDYYWEKLGAGGKEQACGWLKDKYGLSWQVTPTVLSKFLQDKDTQKVKRVTDAFMKMVKFDIAALQRAYDGT